MPPRPMTIASQSRRPSVMRRGHRGTGTLERQPLDGDDRHHVADPAVEGHGQHLVERQPADLEVLRPVGRRDAVGQAARDEQHRELVRDAVGEVDPGQLAPVRGGHPGLLDELAPGTLERRLTRGHAALRDLPGVLVERVAVLPDEEDAVLVVEDQDACREVGEVDDAVDARLAVRPGDLVVPDRDPGVLVGDAAGVAGPRAAGDRRDVGLCGVARLSVVHPRHRRMGRSLASGGRSGTVDSRRWPPTTRRTDARRARPRTRSRRSGAPGSPLATGSTCRRTCGCPRSCRAARTGSRRSSR